MLRQLFGTLGVIARRISKTWTALKLDRFVAVVFVGFFLLTTSVDKSSLSASTKTMLNDMIAGGETGRPVTSAQWKAQNERLEDQPLERVEAIAKQSADAVGEMGEIYPGNVKSVLPGMENESLERDD